MKYNDLKKEKDFISFDEIVYILEKGNQNSQDSIDIRIQKELVNQLNLN